MMNKISTGEDSTLATYLKIAKDLGPEADEFIQKKIEGSPNGENEEVIIDERQMLTSLSSIQFELNNQTLKKRQERMTKRTNTVRWIASGITSGCLMAFLIGAALFINHCKNNWPITTAAVGLTILFFILTFCIKKIRDIQMERDELLSKKD